jgi:predicted lipoprotein
VSSRGGSRVVQIAVLALGIAVAAGCGDSGPSREDVLADLAAEAIVPAYEQLRVATADLREATEQLCAEPGEETAAQARAALADARAAWKRTQAVWVGPVMERRSWARVDWPVEPDDIDGLLADDTVELTVETLRDSVGADQRGLSAMEHVLGADARSAAAAAGDDRRCAYLIALAGIVADEAASVGDGWTLGSGDGPPYAETFGSSEDSLDMLVNDALFLLEAMTDTELGNALGLMGGEPDPAAVAEGPEGLGVADLQGRLDGLRAVLVGGDSQPGISALLGDDLTERLASQFDAADEALAGIDPPLREAATASPATVEAARDALKAIQVTLATEVVSRLGVTIGFSDADGDSG